MPRQIPWTRDQLLVAFNLYCRLPFGQYDQRNKQVRAVAAAIGRTPSALAMKLSNLASFDPIHQQRGVRGLSGASKADKAIWDEFHANWTALAIESEAAIERLAAAGHAELVAPTTAREQVLQLPTGSETETVREVTVRRVQGFFRRAVLSSYLERCAMCGIVPVDLMTASHIIPWAENEKRRADPTNGLSLCALHDRAFDRGLISVDDKLGVVVSRRLRVEEPSETHAVALLRLEGAKLRPPKHFQPDAEALAWHRKNLFVA